MRGEYVNVRNSIIIALVCSVALISSCKKAPEEEPGLQITSDTAGGVTLDPLELPQANSTIGISVTAVPDGIVVVYNDGNWIELVEENQPTVRYTFISNSDDMTGITPTTITEFESQIVDYEDGRMTGEGTVETALGQADWASGSYSEDGEILEMVYFLAPHPSGIGELVLTSVCPPDMATVERRLKRIRQITSHVG